MKSILKYFEHWPAMFFGAVVSTIFLIVIFSYQVKSTEVVIVKTLGKISVQKEAGLHFCWPYPVDIIFKFDNRMHCFDGFAGKIEEVSTREGEPVVIGMFTVYRILDAEKLFRNAGNIYKAEVLLDNLMRSARNSVVGAHYLSDFINTENGKVKIGTIEDEIKKDFEADAMNALGLKIEAVGIKTLILPEKITEKVFERMKAERNVLSGKYRSFGKSEAKAMRDEADNKRKSTIAEAETKARIIRSEGDELAAKYYSVFKENPELAAFLRKLDSLNRMKPGKLTLLIKSGAYPFDIMNENLINEQAKGKPR
jgi:membrane protease subunit HflC